MSARLIVDLDAFSANLAAVRARVAPAAHMLVVKDDAYGHGLEPIVRRAWAEGVRWIGAFDVATGLAVRTLLGTGARVFVWQVGSAAEARAALEGGLDIGVGDAGLLEDVAGVATSSPARVHLKIDTGLHRNGVRPEHWPAFVARAAELEGAGAVRVVGIWSHIAEASDAEDDDARDAFERAVHAARDAGLRPELRHLAASAAAFARPEFRYDLVRIGAFAYGIRSADGPSAAELGLAPVARLTASVEHVDDAGVRVDVGALHGLPSTLRGRVAVGTAAGPRRLLAVDDLTSRVEAWDAAARGDEVTVYGPGASGEGSATDLGEAIGTIGEEIALRVSPQVPRCYTG
jgi:alanine racemase